MFTKGGERLIIRGDGNVIKVSEKMFNDLINDVYGKFSEHTHQPGYSLEPEPAEQIIATGKLKNGKYEPPVFA